MTAEQSSLLSLVQSHENGVFDLIWQGFPCRLVKAGWGEIVISLHGGQVLFCRFSGHEPVLWVSDCPKPSPAAVRGGIPICWPWFADHPEDSTLPAHGVVRTAQWIIEQENIDSSSASWRLVPESSGWPGLTLSLRIEVSEESLCLEMETCNTGDKELPVSQAFHSYLRVSKLSQVEIKGLDGRQYVDKLDEMKIKTHREDCGFPEAFDSIFEHSGDVCILDHGWHRALKISKKYSNSTVTWNPGLAAEKVADIGLDQVADFVCVEAARTTFFDDVNLQPGQSVKLQTSISISDYSSRT